jgi:alpha-tubulin suppressor-like RCC1 family protein
MECAEEQRMLMREETDPTHTHFYLSRCPHAGMSTASAIALGYAHTCVVASGNVLCWGWNEYGQLGIGSTTDQTIPVTLSLGNQQHFSHCCLLLCINAHYSHGPSHASSLRGQ